MIVSVVRMGNVLYCKQIVYMCDGYIIFMLSALCQRQLLVGSHRKPPHTRQS